MKLLKPFNQCCVLVVDDNKDQRQALCAVLNTHFNTIEASGSDDIESFFIGSQQPDMVLIAIEMDGSSGLTLCQVLRSNPVTEEVPVIMVTDNISDHLQERCWEAGATDFVVNPVPATLLHRSRSHLNNYLQIKAMEKLLMHDALTGVKNRTYMHEEATFIIEDLARKERPLGVILVDIDDFKKLNDTFGHEHGDKCLQAVAKAIAQHTKRSYDTVIRFGGEEFLVILPRADKQGVSKLAADIVSSVAKVHLKYNDKIISRVTASVGATWRDNMSGHDLETMIHEADMAMYTAKRAGKNRFTLAQPVDTGKAKKYSCWPTERGRFINSVERNTANLAKYKA